MKNIPVARGYAHALLDVTTGNGSSVALQLDAFTHLIHHRPELLAEHMSLLDQQGVLPIVGRLLWHLVQRDRVGLVPSIARYYRRFAEASERAVEVVVELGPLTKSRWQTMTAQLAALGRGEQNLKRRVEDFSLRAPTTIEPLRFESAGRFPLGMIHAH